MDAPFISPISQTRDQKRQFDIGRVIQRTVQIARDRPVSMFVAAVVLVAAPAAAGRWILLTLLPRHAGPFAILFGVAQSALLLILASICTAWITLVAVDDTIGQRNVGVVAQLLRLLMSIGPLVLGSLLFYFCVYGAMFLLLVPGLMLSVAWSLATPVLIIENLNPVRSLSRSALLTRGNRWSIFALMGGTWFIVGVVQLIIRMLFAGTFDITHARMTPLVSYVVIPVTASLVRIAVSTVIASIYIELTRINEHAGFASVDEVFA